MPDIKQTKLYWKLLYLIITVIMAELYPLTQSYYIICYYFPGNAGYPTNEQHFWESFYGLIAVITVSYFHIHIYIVF